MTLTSISFYIFLPICILVYFLIPSRFRYVWLLFVSYFFYSTLDGAFVMLLVVSTVITWLSGNTISIVEKKKIKILIMIIGIMFNIMMLFIYKYEDFFLAVAKSDIRLNLILPAGISFYTFQSLTYIIDIYRGDAKPERNFFKYALFVSFFPLILSGPIERASHLLPQFSRDVKFDVDRAKDGLKLMLFGYFLKIVIVARMAILTDFVFTDYLNKNSVALIIAVLAYTVQIYCDFAGYSSIAIGMSKIMGFDIIKNFNQPYFAVSVTDFWRRWHISLSTWFRDYLYIPLGGNRKGRIRKYINIMIVFIVSGLWHGANMTFVVWGFLNGIYQVIGDILKPVKLKVLSLLCKQAESNGANENADTFQDNNPGKTSHKKESVVQYQRNHLARILQTLVTFILISFTWIFFRSSSVYEAGEIIKRIFSSFSYVNLFDGTLWNVGLGVNNMLFALAAIVILIIADVLCERKKCDVSGLLLNTKAVVRWAVYYVMILMILLSMNLNMTEFIYSNF